MPDHFYTTDPKGELALQAGYKYLGIACYVYNQQVKGTVPVYRGFQAGASGDHFYTTNRDEFDNAVHKIGYKAEGIAWFMFNKPDHAALLRFYNPKTGDHLYCTAQDQAKVADFSAFNAEGVAGYVVNSNECAEDGTRAVPLYWWFLG